MDGQCRNILRVFFLFSNVDFSETDAVILHVHVKSKNKNREKKTEIEIFGVTDKDGDREIEIARVSRKHSYYFRCSRVIFSL